MSVDFTVYSAQSPLRSGQLVQAMRRGEWAVQLREAGGGALAHSASLDAGADVYGWDPRADDAAAIEAAISSGSASEVADKIGVCEILFFNAKEIAEDLEEREEEGGDPLPPVIADAMQKAKSGYTICAPIGSSAGFTAEVQDALMAALISLGGSVTCIDDEFDLCS
jgi:hypothetical protein